MAQSVHRCLVKEKNKIAIPGWSGIDQRRPFGEGGS